MLFSSRPAGFEIDLGDIKKENDIIGRQILFRYAGRPLPVDDYGWYRGKIHSALSASDKGDPENYGCGFWAVFDVKVNAANARLHAAYKTKPRALLAVGADTASRGERWVLLRRAKA